MKILKWLREQIDKLFLSDHDWKKKYCPDMYNYLFIMSEEERHKMWEDHRKWCAAHPESASLGSIVESDVSIKKQ